MYGLEKILAFLDLLEEAGVHYSITKPDSNSLQVFFTLVGARIEVDVYPDRMSYRCFKGNEDVHNDISLLEQLMMAG